MNKVLASLLMIGMVAAMVGAGTFANLTDTETSTGNTIEVGEIELVVNDQAHLDGAVVTIEDIKPCWYEAWVKKITVTNNDGYLQIRLFDIVNATGAMEYPTSGGVGPATNEPEYEAEGAKYVNGAWDASGWNAKDDVSTVITCTMRLYEDDGDGEYTDGDETHVDTYCTGAVLDDLQAGGMMPAEYLDGYKLKTGTTYWIVQIFHMGYTYDDDNVYQGDVCTFSEEFSVMQTGDPTPGADLHGHMS